MPEVDRKPCTRCGRIKLLVDFPPMKRGPYGRSSWCRDCNTEYRVEKAKSLRRTKNYIAVSSKVCTVCGIRKKPSKFFARTASPDCLGNACKTCQDKSNKQGRKNLKKDIIKGYGGKCECCGESHEEFLQLDHKNGDGAAERRKLGNGLRSKSDVHYKLYRLLRRLNYPRDNHQLLCANCNWAKGMYGYCPHKKKSETPQCRSNS